MSVETVLLVVIAVSLACIFGYHLKLSERLDSVEEILKDLRIRIDDIPISEEARLRRCYESAQSLTAENVRQWKQGQMVWLIEECGFYPSTKLVHIYLEYKHGGIDTETPSILGFKVHGYSRLSEDEEWEPYEFDAGDRESQSGAGSCAVRHAVNPL